MLMRLNSKYAVTSHELQLKTVTLRRSMLQLTLIALCLLLQSLPLFADSPQKSRLIVLTDIGADPDDTMSMVRLLLYSDEIDIQGLIATTSCWKKTSVSPELIRQVIEAYAKVQPNLNRNEPVFPAADVLLQRLKSGIPEYGMQGVGEGKDSEGSDWIIKVIVTIVPK